NRTRSAGLDLHVSCAPRFQVFLVHLPALVSGGGEIAKELLVQMRDRGPACLSGAPDVVQRGLGRAIVEKIFGRQQPEALQERRVEERRAIDLRQETRIAPQPRKLRFAVAGHLAQPTEMVQAEVVEMTA